MFSFFSAPSSLAGPTVILSVNVTVLYLPVIGILYPKVIGRKATLAYPFKTILILIADNYQVLIGAIIISVLQIRKL